MFLRAPLGDEARERLLSLRTETDDLRVHGREVYWLCRVPFADSPLAKAPLEKTMAMPSTTRNVTTLRKLAAKYGGSSREPGSAERVRRKSLISSPAKLPFVSMSGWDRMIGLFCCIRCRFRLSG